MIDIKELDRLARAATPGPWKCGQGRKSMRAVYDKQPETMMYAIEGPDGVGDYEDWGYTRANAEYMAAADPTNILSLLKQLRKAKETIRMLEKSLEGAGR